MIGRSTPMRLGGTTAGLTRYLVGNADPLTSAMLRWDIAVLPLHDKTSAIYWGCLPCHRGWARTRTTVRRYYGNHEMLRASGANRYCLLAIIMFGALGNAAVAIADPVAPTKVPTVRITPQGEDHRDPPAEDANPSKVHTLTVRPRFSDEQRNLSGRLPAKQDPGNAVSDSEPHVVQTTPIRPEGGATGDYNQHFVHTIPVPSLSAPH